MTQLTQLSLFPAQPQRTRRKRSDSRSNRRPRNVAETSREARQKTQPIASKLARRVFEYLASRDTEGATDSEIEQALELPGNTERPRRRWLVTHGFVEDSGETRPTPSGCNAAVWIVTGKPLPSRQTE